MKQPTDNDESAYHFLKTSPIAISVNKIMTVHQTILEIFIDKLGVGLEEITDTTTNNDLGIDSLDKVELVMEIEKEFNIELTDSDMDSLKQFSDYVAVVERKLA